MLNITKKLQMRRTAKPLGKEPNDGKVSVRDILLVKGPAKPPRSWTLIFLGVQEMEHNMPRMCRIHFEDPNKLHKFQLTVTPDDGYYQGGKYKFCVDVPEEYNIMPPIVKCETRIWHPNINEDGEVCLSLLRPNSLDGLGWAPTRRLKDVVWGLNSLFSDLLNFEDPLNVEAAEHYERDKDAFVAKVKDYIQRYAKR